MEEELRGNTDDYYDPRNSYLNQVLERRLGIPISLCIVYWTVAELLGLSLTGVNLPCHFMLRFDEDGQPWFIDPFDAGAIYDRSRCQRIFVQIAQVPLPVFDASIAPCSTEVVVTRMLRNLKAIYLQTGDLPSLLPVQRRLTALNPREPGELRDLGMLCAQTDHLAEAINPLRAYLGVPLPLTMSMRSEPCWKPFSGRLRSGIERNVDRIAVKRPLRNRSGTTARFRDRTLRNPKALVPTLRVGMVFVPLCGVT